MNDTGKQPAAKTKRTYTVSMYRVDTCSKVTFEATSLADAVRQFRATNDLKWMTAFVRAPGGKRGYDVKSFDAWREARS